MCDDTLAMIRIDENSVDQGMTLGVSVKNCVRGAAGWWLERSSGGI
jgi:hypothetical protein